MFELLVDEETDKIIFWGRKTLVDELGHVFEESGVGV